MQIFLSQIHVGPVIDKVVSDKKAAEEVKTEPSSKTSASFSFLHFFACIFFLPIWSMTSILCRLINQHVRITIMIPDHRIQSSHAQAEKDRYARELAEQEEHADPANWFHPGIWFPRYSCKLSTSGGLSSSFRIQYPPQPQRFDSDSQIV